MNKLFLILVMAAAASTSAYSQELVQPLGLDWNTESQVLPPLTGYKYYMGAVEYGTVTYLGLEDLFEVETELQLSYTRKGKISKALLILGPLGLDEQNCIKKYKTVSKFLSKKYGSFRYKLIEKDPVVDEMVYASDCYPISLGLYKVDSYWFFKGFKITSSLIGEDTQFFIEIEYVNLRTETIRKKSVRKETLKRL